MVLREGFHSESGGTWVHTVAGDTGALQPPGQFQCEEHVAQLAVAVGLEELPAEAASAQVLFK